MSFRKPCHMPFRKLIPPFTLTVLVWVVDVSVAVHPVLNECNEVFALNGCITTGVRVGLFGKQRSSICNYLKVG